MPDNRFFQSLSTLLAGPTVVFGTLLLLELSLKIDPPRHRPVTRFTQVTIDVTAGPAYTRAPSVDADRAPSDNGSALGRVQAGSEVENLTLQANYDEESGAGQTLEPDAHADLGEVASVEAESAKPLGRAEQSMHTVTELSTGFEEDELAGGEVQTAVQQVVETKSVLHIDELQTQEPVRTVVANRDPEQSMDTVTEPGAGFGEDELAGGVVQTAAQQVVETKSVLHIDELQTQEPVRTVVANRDPEHAVFAETQEPKEDGEAPIETAKQSTASAAKDLSNKIERRQQDTLASGVRLKKKPVTPSRAQQQRKSPPSRWTALSLGSAKEASHKKAKTPRVGARDYNMRVWSSIARHKPKLGRGGSTTVTFGIGGNGMLRGVRVSRSSGDVRLDRIAIATVRKAAPFPKPPAGLGSRPFTVMIYFR